MTSNTPWLTRKEAAEYARTTPGHLANLASKGIGPKVQRRDGSSKVLYNRHDLDAWIIGEAIDAHDGRL